MPKKDGFDNIDDLINYIQYEINKINEDEEKELLKAAQTFKKILEEEIANYYNSYEPKVYERTWRFLKSVQVNKVERDENGPYIIVNFNDLATHPSIFGPKYEPGFVPILLSLGYSWRKPDNRYHFSWYSYPQPLSPPSEPHGHNFLQIAVERFNNLNLPFTITEEIVYNGRKIERRN